MELNQSFWAKNHSHGILIIKAPISRYSNKVLIILSLQLLNNCLTANKKYEIDFETVLATVGFNSGRHYWEIKLDTFVEMEDIFVGVARRNIDLYIRAWDTGSFWGWICTG